MQTPAKYYDGQSAVETTGMATVRTARLYLVLQDQQLSWPVSEVTLIPPVGSGNYVIELPDQGRLIVPGGELVNQLGAPHLKHSLIGWLEGSWRWALAALALSIISLWLMLNFGVPAAAKRVANWIPPHLETQISEDGLALMDKALFSTSQLDWERQQELQILFDEVLRITAPDAPYQLVFRNSESIGPNALALPGGTIVMTDQMVEIAESDQELAAVLAHEVGHQIKRHSMRTMLQSSLSALILASVTGDISGISALGASIPTVLLHNSYSRDFEREADAVAFQFLEQKGWSTRTLSRLLLRIESEHRVGDIPSFLSTHPASEDRLPEQ